VLVVLLPRGGALTDLFRLTLKEKETIPGQAIRLLRGPRKQGGEVDRTKNIFLTRAGSTGSAMAATVLVS